MLAPTTYSTRPRIMAIGDSMYQGIRSLSFVPSMTAHSTPGQVARALGLPMTVPNLSHPLLFDLEAEIRKGGLVRLLTHLRDICRDNIQHWPLDKPWSRHEAFDNIAIGGAGIASLWNDTYDRHIGDVRSLVVQLQAGGQSARDLLLLVAKLWYALNNCYTLNPRHRGQQGDRSALQQVADRKPRILLINIGSNEGLFRAGFLANFSEKTMDGVRGVRTLVAELADRLAELPDEVEQIVFNNLVQPRFMPNLMPNPEDLQTRTPADYYLAYGPRAINSQFPIAGSDLQKFDNLVHEVNQDAEQILRNKLGDRVRVADLYGMCAALDGKHVARHGLPIPGTKLVLDNRALEPRPGGFAGGLASLDNMHPTVPGYAVIADVVLAALGQPGLKTNKADALAADPLLSNFPGRAVLGASVQLAFLGSVLMSLEPEAVAIG